MSKNIKHYSKLLRTKLFFNWKKGGKRLSGIWGVKDPHRAKEEFESEEGKAILKKLGIEGNYEGIGNLILGYAAAPAEKPAPRKANYVFEV